MVVTCHTMNPNFIHIVLLEMISSLIIQTAILLSMTTRTTCGNYDQNLHVGLNLNSLTLLSPSACEFESEIDYLYGVHTAPSHFELRNTLRNSWASSEIYPNKTRRVFLIGQSNTTLEKAIIKESKTFGDIFMYNQVDAYRNMTIKVCYFIKRLVL